MQIGTIPCSAPTCADDVSLIADSEKTLQILIDTVVNYSKQENYKRMDPLQYLAILLMFLLPDSDGM
jgi:hypothetical protein